MSEILLDDVSLTYAHADKPTLQGISFEVQASEFVSIVGKSGSGKTSLLQLVAGLQQPTSGEIRINNQKVFEPIEGLTYLFQRPVLLEWKTVLENVLLPVGLKRKMTQQDREQALSILETMGLADSGAKFPYECSGGMQARVAIARAFMNEPKVLLMDEPFSALDRFTKNQLHEELLKVVQTVKPTVLCITHDIQEAVYLSDRVFLLGAEPTGILDEMVIPFEKPRSKEIGYEAEFQRLVRTLDEKLQK
jgi:NitT/TauT family transport system ATP-binding protein